MRFIVLTWVKYVKLSTMQRTAWTRDQLVKTLALYCQLPFGKMHSGNPAVVALAETIGRTSSAVAFRLSNFASLDPELRARGVKGMKNTSADSRAIWQEFYGSWEALADNAIVMDPPPVMATASRKRTAPAKPPSGPTEVARETKQRRGQYFFRAAVLAAHDAKCCITGITSEPMLRASHIVPWSHDPSLRLDPRNGLCLNALHDAAFDRGLITLSDRFELRVSKRVKDEVPTTVYQEMFVRRMDSAITMPERFKPSAEMLEFHRTKVFCA